MSSGICTQRYSADQIRAYYDAGLWTANTLHDVLRQRVADSADKVFATDGTHSLTYRELYDNAGRLAAGLHRRGWRAGDTAAIQLPNWVEFLQIAVALSRLGVIIVPIMPIYRRDEVGYVLGNADVRAVFTPAEFKGFDYLDMYLGLRRDRPALEIVVVRATSTTDGVCSLASLEADDDAGELGVPAGPDDPFVIVYTSGTTSRPKGCVHTFNTYCSSARGLTAAFGYGATDVQFGPSPITHSTGLVTSMLLPLINGAATHLMADWDPSRALDDIARFGCTAAVTAPTFLQMLLSAYEPARHDLSSLRLWVSAGAPIPTAIVERANDALPGVKILSLYGRSENLCTTTCAVSDEPSRALTSDGAALPGSEVLIVDRDGTEVPRGAEGDIAYRGPSHMIEYLANPAETAALFTADGFSRSGDLGRMTEDGFVRVSGRLKDIIIRGGMNISVREVEDALAAHPGLAGAAVVGVPDERLGERVGCVIVVADGHPDPTTEELRSYLVERGIAIQKTPERVVVADELPTTATGKVQKHLLRNKIEAWT